jgi:ABC-type multidrug transport system fused ATPase/permease subunit
MVMPLAGRVAAAVAGGLLVLAAVSSVTVTLIVSRPARSRLTRWVDRMVDWAYEQVAVRVGDYRRRDQLRATQAAVVLLAQLAAWLIVAYAGFALLLWPFATRGVASAFVDAGSSLFTLGFAVPAGTAPAVIVFLAAATGLVIPTLQIAYLPTLYAAFNRRETQVVLLSERAGVPSWGPELLARTHYALGTRMSTLDTMPDLYARWESWAADVAESHTTYPVLVRFRSPGPLSSWVTALLAVLDSAALYLALSPQSAPVVQARLCLRSGFVCLREIAQAMGFDIPDEPDPDAGITLTYQEFLDAVARLRKVDFRIERDPADAWPDFVGWRVNYELAAYTIAYALDVVPAMWSGPRRRPTPPITPFRPPPGRAE